MKVVVAAALALASVGCSSPCEETRTPIKGGAFTVAVTNDPAIVPVNDARPGFYAITGVPKTVTIDAATATVVVRYRFNGKDVVETWKRAE